STRTTVVTSVLSCTPVSTCVSSCCVTTLLFFFSNDTATPEIYTLSLHDALPISLRYRRDTAAATPRCCRGDAASATGCRSCGSRSEEHTSELQSRFDLVCRLLLEKKKKTDAGATDTTRHVRT